MQKGPNGGGLFPAGALMEGNGTAAGDHKPVGIAGQAQVPIAGGEFFATCFYHRAEVRTQSGLQNRARRAAL
ncbi:MAG TPA: hypothetical protein VIL63_13265 [Terriglobales bacterium]